MAIRAGGLVDVADFIDSGWIDCPLAAGVAAVNGHSMQVRMIGIEIYIRGRATADPASGTQVWCTMPAEFWPDRIVEISHRTASSSPERVYVTPDGELRSQSTPTSAQIQVNHSWIRAE